MILANKRFIFSCLTIIFCLFLAGCRAGEWGYSDDSSVITGATVSGIITQEIAAGSLRASQSVTPAGNAKVWLEERPDIFTFTDADGFFQIVGVPQGDFHIVCKLTQGNAIFKQRILVVITSSDDKQTADMMLAEARYTVRGVLRDEGGNFLPPGTRLWLWGEEFILEENGEFTSPPLPKMDPDKVINEIVINLGLPDEFRLPAAFVSESNPVLIEFVIPQNRSNAASMPKIYLLALLNDAVINEVNHDSAVTIKAFVFPADIAADAISWQADKGTLSETTVVNGSIHEKVWVSPPLGGQANVTVSVTSAGKVAKAQYPIKVVGPSSFSLVYNGNGNDTGSVPVDPRGYLPYEEVTVLGNENNLVKNGFNFAGWNTSADGNGTVYVQGNVLKMVSANLILYAIWSEVVNQAPVIVSNGGSANAAVNAAENQASVTTVAATDPENDTLTFSIGGGADAAKFAINSSSGMLTFVAAPDFEAPSDSGANNVYDVQVSVSDGTNTASQNIAATVTDVNEPLFITSNGGDANAAISMAENQTAVTTVTAADPENGNLTFSVSGGADAAKFAINSSSGILTFAAAPDFEVPSDSGANNVYDVQVSVSDGTNTASQNIAVMVTNVNDMPVITSNGGGANAAVNAAENQTAVTTVAATDPENDTLTFSIGGGADAAKFAINSSSGILTFVAAPDFEAPSDSGANNVYDVQVSVSDGTIITSQNIAVTVADVNEPLFITSNGGGATAAISMAENQTAVTTVTAADPENGTLAFSVSGGADAAKFAINSSTGVLIFGAAPDFEAPSDSGANNVYDVQVSVFDGVNTTSQNIAITVADVNEIVTFTTIGGTTNGYGQDGQHGSLGIPDIYLYFIGVTPWGSGYFKVYDADSAGSPGIFGSLPDNQAYFKVSTLSDASDFTITKFKVYNPGISAVTLDIAGFYNSASPHPPGVGDVNLSATAAANSWTTITLTEFISISTITIDFPDETPLYFNEFHIRKAP